MEDVTSSKPTICWQTVFGRVGGQHDSGATANLRPGLLQALRPIADDFVVAGAQAMKFMLRQARATKDIDFVLDVVALRGEKESVAQTLQKLGYSVVPGNDGVP